MVIEAPPHEGTPTPEVGVLHATSRLLDLATEPRRAALLARVLRGLVELLPRLSPRHLEEALRERSDYGVLAHLVEAPEAVDAWKQVDPFAAARRRAVEVRRQLLAAEGGAETVSGVAERLGISRQAVDKRRRSGKLVALETRRGHVYPVWQFAGDRVLTGLEAVLRSLDADGYERAAWFLNPNPRLGDARPLDLLRRGQVEAVRRAASAYGEQGAA